MADVRQWHKWILASMNNELKKQAEWLKKEISFLDYPDDSMKTPLKIIRWFLSKRRAYLMPCYKCYARWGHKIDCDLL